MARRALGAALLAALLAPLPAAAGEWTEVAPDNGVYSAYADRSTIHRAGSVATMQGLYDFPHGDFTPNGTPFYSTVVEREYDCSAHQVRLMRFADHARHGGEGEIVSAFSEPRRWEPVLDDSLDARYWKIACEAI